MTKRTLELNISDGPVAPRLGSAELVMFRKRCFAGHFAEITLPATWPEPFVECTISILEIIP